MKRALNNKFAAALALILALALPSASVADPYSALAARLAGCAVKNSIKKIAVVEFAGKGGAGKIETEYVAEKVSLQLAGNKKVTLIERSLLEKVLKEASLSSAAGPDDRTQILRNMLSVDAVVTGVVFADGEVLRVFARLIDAGTGRVLLAAEGETARLYSDPAGGGAVESGPAESLPPWLPPDLSGTAPSFDPGQRTQVTDLLKMEESVFNECELY